jgi:mono/diheme cytochrome c family protein
MKARRTLSPPNTALAGALLVLVAAATIGVVRPARAAGTGPDLGTDAQRQSGKALYEKDCSQCHGDKGDGQGPAAIHLRPMPRDFTRGKFKVRTTPNGALPMHQDLVHIIRTGMPYTSMPAWPKFSDEQLSDLAYYVQSFSPDFANAELVPKPVDLPKPPAPVKDAATTGKSMYEDSGCLKCHGNKGRGDGQSAPTLKDDWGHPIKPADLSQRWTWRGGGTRADLYRTLSTGFNGTPMPSYADALTPEQRWLLVDYIMSLGPETPAYANLIVAKHLDDPIDLHKTDEAFANAPVARLPVVGQIMEPVRSFHPPVTSVLVQAVYDAESIAIRVRWDDLSAQTTGHNGPSLAADPADEKEAPPTGAEGTAPAAGGDVWGEAAEPAAPAKTAPPAGGDDVWGEQEAAAPTGEASEFSDAVAVQIPMAASTGARKPYFIFGDPGNAVDLWVMDLARKEPQQFTGRGSQDIAPNDTGEVQAAAQYDEGEWSVVFKRPLRPSTTGLAFAEGQFVPVAFSVWDGFTRERGSRRALTLWYHLYVEPAVTVSPAGAMIKTAVVVLVLEILVIVLVRRRFGRGGAPSGASVRVQHIPSAS